MKFNRMIHFYALLVFIFLPMQVKAVNPASQNFNVEGHENRVKQLIESDKKRLTSQNIIVKGDYNTVIQIVGSFPPKLLNEFLKDASERAELARQLNMTESALRKFLIIIKENNIGTKDLPRKLAEIAFTFNHLKERIARIDGNDPIINDLKRRAQLAASELDWKEADRLLQQAKERDIEIGNELKRKWEDRYLGAADTSSLSALAVLLGFKYELASMRFDEAAELVPDAYPYKKLGYIRESGFNLERAGKFSLAKDKYQNAIDLGNSSELASSLEYVKTIINLAGVVRDLGDTKRAKELYKSIETTLATLDDESKNIISNAIPNELGLLYIMQGDLDKAESALKLSISTNRQYASVGRHNLGLILLNRGSYEEARKIFEKDLSEIVSQYGAQNPMIALVSHNLARSLNGIRDYKKALHYHQKALAIALKSLRPKHPDIAIYKSGIGETLLELRKYNEAQKIFEEALEIISNQFGSNHPMYANVNNGVGDSHFFQGNLVQAEKYYTESLQSREKVLGKGHPDAVYSMNSLAKTYYLSGKRKKAKEMYLQAINNIKLTGLSVYKNHTESLCGLANIYLEEGLLKYARVSLRKSEVGVIKSDAIC